MNCDKHGRLLRDLLHSDELAELRHDSLSRMLVAARQRQRRRRMGRVATMITLSLLLIAGIISIRAPRPPDQPQMPMASAKAAESLPKATSAKVKIISDEGLFALFPDRPMALIGPVGKQRLVFLENGSVKHPER